MFPRSSAGTAADAGRAVASIPEEAPLPPAGGSLARQKVTAGLGRVLRALARSRAGGNLLHALEWVAYEQALSVGRWAQSTMLIACPT